MQTLIAPPRPGRGGGPPVAVGETPSTERALKAAAVVHKHQLELSLAAKERVRQLHRTHPSTNVIKIHEDTVFDRNSAADGRTLRRRAEPAPRPKILGAAGEGLIKGERRAGFVAVGRHMGNAAAKNPLVYAPPTVDPKRTPIWQQGSTYESGAQRNTRFARQRPAPTPRAMIPVLPMPSPVPSAINTDRTLSPLPSSKGREMVDASVSPRPRVVPKLDLVTPQAQAAISSTQRAGEDKTGLRGSDVKALLAVTRDISSTTEELKKERRALQDELAAQTAKDKEQLAKAQKKAAKAREQAAQFAAQADQAREETTQAQKEAAQARERAASMLGKQKALDALRAGIKMEQVTKDMRTRLAAQADKHAQQLARARELAEQAGMAGEETAQARQETAKAREQAAKAREQAASMLGKRANQSLVRKLFGAWGDATKNAARQRVQVDLFKKRSATRAQQRVFNGLKKGALQLEEKTFRVSLTDESPPPTRRGSLESSLDVGIKSPPNTPRTYTSKATQTPFQERILTPNPTRWTSSQSSARRSARDAASETEGQPRVVVVREKPTTRDVGAGPLSETDAAIQIQRTWRGKVARNEVKRLNLSALQIQYAWKKSRFDRARTKQKQEREEARLRMTAVAEEMKARPAAQAAEYAQQLSKAKNEADRRVREAAEIGGEDVRSRLTEEAAVLRKRHAEELARAKKATALAGLRTIEAQTQARNAAREAATKQKAAFKQRIDSFKEQFQDVVEPRGQTLAKERAARIIQSKWRDKAQAFTEAHEQSAATLIQRAWRGKAAQKQEAAIAADRKKENLTLMGRAFNLWRTQSKEDQRRARLAAAEVGWNANREAAFKDKKARALETAGMGEEDDRSRLIEQAAAQQAALQIEGAGEFARLKTQEKAFRQFVAAVQRSKNKTAAKAPTGPQEAVGMAEDDGTQDSSLLARKYQGLAATAFRKTADEERVQEESVSGRPSARIVMPGIIPMPVARSKSKYYTPEEQEMFARNAQAASAKFKESLRPRPTTQRRVSGPLQRGTAVLTPAPGAVITSIRRTAALETPLVPKLDQKSMAALTHRSDDSESFTSGSGSPSSQSYSDEIASALSRARSPKQKERKQSRESADIAEMMREIS